MPHDRLGNPVTCAGTATLGAIDDFVHGLLAYETRAERIAAAADADPGCCLANVYAGFLWMFLESPDAASRAAPYIAAAERAAGSAGGTGSTAGAAGAGSTGRAAGAGGASARERLNLALLKAWASADVTAAIELCDRITDEHPRDLVALKLQQYFEFNRGNFPALLRAALKVLPHNTDVPYVYGMAAFGYEQCHLLDEAERSARIALEAQRNEPWAQHALAHVMLTRGRIDEGVRFLEGMQDTWAGLNSFMSTHLWWHLALLHLSQGRFARALEIYDEHCWAIAKDYSQDQIGAVSLLARFELAGVELGVRWQDLADHLTARAADLVLPFLTLQYLYGLARAARVEASELLEAVRRAARGTHDRGLWAEVVLPAAEGLYAHARGDHETAWTQLSRALPRLIETGGSHAQRDLFEQILIDAALESRRLVPVQQMLEMRRAGDPDGVPVNRALARVYAELGLPALAEAAAARAAATQARHAVPA